MNIKPGTLLRLKGNWFSSERLEHRKGDVVMFLGFESQFIVKVLAGAKTCTLGIAINPQKLTASAQSHYFDESFEIVEKKS